MGVSGEGTPRECGVSSKGHKNILKFFCNEVSFNDWNTLKVTELYTELDELYGTQISSQ